LMNFRGCALRPRRLIGVDAGLCGSFEHGVGGTLGFVGNAGSVGNKLRSIQLRQRKQMVLLIKTAPN